MALQSTGGFFTSIPGFEGEGAWGLQSGGDSPSLGAFRMSDYDRGPYTPSERPLSFETRYPRELPPRRRGPAPVALVASIVVLTVMVAGGGFLLYRNGVRGPNDAPRPVGAPVSDVRTIAPPQAQAAEPGAGLAVYRAD